MTDDPVLIQGGMGVAVSSWRLARAVARAGQLGVVSGTAVDTVMARRLQDGDPDGDVRRALAAFPVPELAEAVLRRYYVSGGREPDRPYAPVPRLRVQPNPAALQLAIVASFAEVWLAKEGHDGLVGTNLLEKIQMATPAVLYGAMLAGVDVVLMGAGIPTEIPRLLERFARHETGSLSVHVDGAPAREYATALDPTAVLGRTPPPVRRPRFLAIVSSHVLAEYLARDPATRPDGFVVEGPSAGGHNAPPRGRLTLDDSGQPVYGPRDEPDLSRMRALGLPFWLAGSHGTPEAVGAALEAGANGVQAGTIFALSEDSGLAPALRASLLDGLRRDALDVVTDPRASPTGFPFKVARLPGTLTEPTLLAGRERLCDLGYLRVPYVREGGAIGYRCPAEPDHTFVRKGGPADDTAGRICLCNALMANAGLGQVRRDGYAEPPLVTLGADLDGVRRMADSHPGGWTALDAVRWLVADVPEPAAGTTPSPVPAPAG